MSLANWQVGKSSRLRLSDETNKKIRTQQKKYRGQVGQHGKVGQVEQSALKVHELGPRLRGDVRRVRAPRNSKLAPHRFFQSKTKTRLASCPVDHLASCVGVPFDSQHLTANCNSPTKMANLMQVGHREIIYHAKPRS
jgi:hypothetical protein